MDEKHSATWIVFLIGGILVLLMAVGGGFALRDQLLAQMRTDAAKQTAEREKLASRIAALESAGAGTGTSDPGVSEQIGALHTQIEDLSKRLETLDQAPAAKAEPAPPSPPPAPAPAPTSGHPTDKGTEGALLVAAVISGKPYDTALTAWQKDHPKALTIAMQLQPFAEKGLPSEAELIAHLRDQLEAIPAPEATQQDGVVSKLNSHLAGMVSIKKVSRDPYAALRTQVLSDPSASLLRTIEQLPEAERRPFTEWCDLARARATVIAALPDIAAGDAP